MIYMNQCTNHEVKVIYVGESQIYRCLLCEQKEKADTIIKMLQEKIGPHTNIDVSK